MSSAGLSVDQRRIALSGGTDRLSTAAQASFLPIALSRITSQSLQSIPIYLQFGQKSKEQPAPTENFRLHRNPDGPFTSDDRQRLLKQGVQFIYIPIRAQMRFHLQAEERIEELVGDQAIKVPEKTAAVYETSVELVNDLLSSLELESKLPRVTRVSRSIANLVIENDTAFSHLFTTAKHDFYTAAHMLNVATWMVPLAYQLGYRDPNVLNQICLAGLLHDIGKVYVPRQILNKRNRLSDEDWALIQQHPILGSEDIAKHEGVDPLIQRVALEHHERTDGSGYPAGLTGEQMHPVSKICAVVDSFDAMTAYRPFKKKTLSITDAMAILTNETSQKFDPEIVRAWGSLLTSIGHQLPCGSTKTSDFDGNGQPDYSHAWFHLRTRFHLLKSAANGWTEGNQLPVVCHNLSRRGTGNQRTKAGT